MKGIANTRDATSKANWTFVLVLTRSDMVLVEIELRCRVAVVYYKKRSDSRWPLGGRYWSDWDLNSAHCISLN